MKTQLPEPLAAYFAARNSHDIDAALASFSENATVRDERKERRGVREIRAWMEETTREYNDTAEVKGIERDGDTHVVTALVSGTFPGSPVMLHFRFTLSDSRIDDLEIG